MMMNMNVSGTPLTEVLPWSIQEPRTILIADSIESDGRFLLHTLASQVLSMKNGRILWLTCGAYTESLVANALKKLGCEVATAYLRNKELASLKIQSLTQDFGNHLLALGDDSSEMNFEAFVKQIYHHVKEWLQSNDETVSWIILDDISALAVLVGERLAYALVLSINALSRTCSVAVRCSHDRDQEEAMNLLKSMKPTWVGAGGCARSNNEEDIPWERSLVEIVDGIIDVVPLASGYTREAHGRLLFSETPTGRGWGGHPTACIYNYCITDTKVLAIRIRGSS